jgi:AsmA family protein
MDALVNFYGDEILTPLAQVQDMRIAARLEEERVRVEPLHFFVGGGHVYAEAVIGASPRPFEAYLAADIERVRLSKVDSRAVAMNRLNGVLNAQVAVRATGAVKAQMAHGAPAGSSSLLGSLNIVESQVSYQMPGRATRLRVTVDSKKIDGRHHVELEGGGTWQGEAFELAFQSDPLLELANVKNNRPYAIEGTVSGAGHEGRVDGALKHPLSFQGIDFAVSVSGSDLNQLSAALGKSLPHIAPYELEGRLTHQGTTWKIADF